jgi:hypothetical protein
MALLILPVQHDRCVNHPVGSKQHRECCVNFGRESVSFSEFVAALRAKELSAKGGDYMAKINPHFRLQSSGCGGWGQHHMVVRWSRSHDAMLAGDPARIDSQVRAAAAAASMDARETDSLSVRETKSGPLQQPLARHEPPLPVLTSLHDGAAAVCDRLGIPESTCSAFFPKESTAAHASNASAILALTYCPGADGTSGRTFPILQQALYLFLRDYDDLRFPYPRWMFECFGVAQHGHAI